MPNLNAATQGGNVFDQFDAPAPTPLPAGFTMDDDTAPATATPSPAPTAAPAQGSSALPAGFTMDDPPHGGNVFDQFDNVAPQAAPAATAAQPPAGNSWSAAMQRVWDNPTPGGLVSIVKGIYGGLKAGATATKMAAGGDMGDDVTDQAVKAAVNLAPIESGGVIRPVSQLPSQVAPSAADAAVQAAERIGVTLPKFMATDGPVAPTLAQGAKAIPWSGKPIYTSASNVRQGLQDAIDTVASPSTPNVAGSAASDGIVNNVKVDAPAQVSALYNKLEGPNGSLTDPTVQVPLTNTMQKMQQLQSARANANLPEWSPSMKILAQAVTDPNGMNYAGLKQLRSYLGQGTPQTLIAEGVNPQEARQLYGPLTEDLKNAVYVGGGQPALNDFTDANALAAANATQRKQLYGIIGAQGNAAPEAVFSRLANAAGTGPSANIGLLQQAKSAMGPQAWNEVGNAIISRLGRDAQGNFSPDRFIGPSGYPSLSSSAKSILFTPQQKSSLDDVSTVSNQVAAKLSKFENTSRTAHVLAVPELAAAAWFHPVATVAGLAGGRLAATALARPAVSQAAANLGRVQLMGASTGAIMARRAALATAIRAELPTAGQSN